jgi:putative phage-type endonuclease
MNTQQGTPAWFNARKGKLTASNFGAAAGVNPYVSRRKALKEAVGEVKWEGNLDACLWGTRNEKNAIKDYMVRTGNVVQSKGFFTHPTYAWLGGSPDGLVGDEGMIEVKCPFVKQVPHAEVPAHYYCQVNGLLEILDRQWCDFISWTPTQMKIYRVWRDPLVFDYLLERYAVFFACMKRGCSEIPSMRPGEKDTVLERIRVAQLNTDTTLWRAVEPENLHGVWEGPPEDPFDDSPSSKRMRNGTEDV